MVRPTLRRPLAAAAATLSLAGGAIVLAAPGADAATPSCTLSRSYSVLAGGAVTLPAESGGTTACLLSSTRGTVTAIKTLQAALNRCNGANLVVDGIYGPLTTAAVKAVQPSGQKDGVYGPVTRASMSWLVDAPRSIRCLTYSSFDQNNVP